MSTEFDDQAEKKEDKTGFQDLFKKVVTTGISAAFMTEEGIRHFLGDIKLPKEVLGTLLQGAQKSKDDLMEKVGQEVIRMIKKIDFVAEASKFAENHKFKVTAEIEIMKKSDGSTRAKIDLGQNFVNAEENDSTASNKVSGKPTIAGTSDSRIEIK